MITKTINGMKLELYESKDLMFDRQCFIGKQFRVSTTDNLYCVPVKSPFLQEACRSIGDNYEKSTSPNYRDTK